MSQALNGKYVGDIVQNAGSDFANVVNGNRWLFVCPGSNLPCESGYSQYACHPRLMPDAYRFPTGMSYAQAVPAAGLSGRPYRLSQIRRGADVCVIFDGSPTRYDDSWMTHGEARHSDAGRAGIGPGNGTYLTDDYAGSTLESTASIDMTPRSGADADLNRDIGSET